MADFGFGAVEMKQSISWSIAKSDFEIGLAADRSSLIRRDRDGCLTRLARSMHNELVVESLGF